MGLNVTISKEIEVDVELGDVLEYIAVSSNPKEIEMIRRAVNGKEPTRKPVSLEDTLIAEHLEKVALKYSFEEIQRLLPL